MPQIPSLPFDLTAIDWTGLLTPYVLYPLLTVALLALAHFGLRCLVAIKTGTWSWSKFPNILRQEGFDLLYSAALGVLADGIPRVGGRVAVRLAVGALLAKMAWELYGELRQDVSDFVAAYFGKPPVTGSVLATPTEPTGGPVAPAQTADQPTQATAASSTAPPATPAAQ